MKFSGKELRNIIENSIENVITDDELEQIGANMLRFSGLSVQIDLKKPYMERIQNIYINDKPVVDDKLYSLAEFNLFMRNSPTALDVTETKRIGPHEVIAYIEKKKHISPELDMRMTDQHGKIMGDHEHLHIFSEQSGKEKVDVESGKAYRYEGRLLENSFIKITK